MGLELNLFLGERNIVSANDDDVMGSCVASDRDLLVCINTGYDVLRRDTRYLNHGDDL